MISIFSFSILAEIKGSVLSVRSVAVVLSIVLGLYMKTLVYSWAAGLKFFTLTNSENDSKIIEKYMPE